MDALYWSCEENGRINYYRLIIMFIGLIVVAILIFLIIHPYSFIFIFDPFFWAFIGMFGLLGSIVTLCCNSFKKHPQFNFFFVVLFALCRFIMVVPAIPQPRFDIYGLNAILGIVIFISGLTFFIPIVQIKPFPSLDENIHLFTSGFYSFTRNPIYLGEILWTIGWSIINGSVIGLAIIPFWWFGLLFTILIEEDELERILGIRYLEYKEMVKGRLIPGLPI